MGIDAVLDELNDGTQEMIHNRWGTAAWIIVESIPDMKISVLVEHLASKVSGLLTDPKTGNRQYGVDIRADNEKELLLFVIKQGDMNRTNWNCGQNAVRQSLNEIRDCYMMLINGTDRNKKLSIVVATNDVMDEAVRPNWEGYKRDNTLWGGISVEITFWDIDTITSHIQKSLLP